MGLWIGLAALALQIVLSPVLSSWALAMELDPLASATICSVSPGAGSEKPPMPMKHCADCCVIHCAAQTAPSLPPAAPDIVPPLVAQAAPELAHLRPLTRGPPPRALPATGPPSTLA